MRCLATSLAAGLLCLAGASVTARPALAQDPSLSDRAPRFLWTAPSGAPVEVEASSSAALRQIVSLDVERATVGSLLASVERQTGLKFVYSRAVLPVDRPVALRADSITVGAALMVILMDTRVDVLLSGGKQVALVRRDAPVVRPQLGAVAGRVTDAETGHGLVGAEVWLDGTRRRTATGENGYYRLADVEAGRHTLSVRRIGYAKRGQPVAVLAEQEATVDVALEPVPTHLDEVVTTMTGEQRLRELGHVVARINADSLVREAPVSTLAELLKNRVPGLQVFTNQGTVGGDVRLQIRGATSTALSNEPIVIVDGIRYTSGRSEDTGPFDVEPTSRLNDLNINDIETIEVVKGPSAATLYGTDAADGVIVITTKRGKPGPARWQLYGTTTRSSIPKTRYPDTYWGWGRAADGSLLAYSCALASQAIGDCTLDSVTVVPSPLNDPSFTIFHSAPQWQYGASVSGGQEDLTYHFSGSTTRAVGPVQLPPALEARLKQQRGVRELPDELRNPNAQTQLSLLASVRASLGKGVGLGVHAGYGQGATRTISLTANPFRGAFEGGSPTDRYGLGYSPTALFAQATTERLNRFNGSANADWQPARWLGVNGTVGVDVANTTRASLLRRGEGTQAEGVVGDARNRIIGTTIAVGATVSLGQGWLGSRTSVGAQYVRNHSDGLSSTGYGLPPGGESIGEATTTASKQSFGETVTLGSYLEQQFSLNDRLFLTGAVRIDGASAFGRNYDVATYPKMGISWVLSEEPFLPRLPGLDELRLRYGFGVSGKQPKPEWGRVSFESFTEGTGGGPTTIRVVDLGNPNLRPERHREHDFGLDAQLLGSRANLSLGWYRSTTVDQLQFLPLPPSAGGNVYTNIGRVTDRGFEATLAASLVQSRALSWTLAIGYSSNATKLVELGDARALVSARGGYVEGYPIGARFVDPIVGYADTNGDEIIVPAEVQLGDTVYAGPNTPPRTLTLTTGVHLFDGRLRLSTSLARSTGFAQVNELKATHCFNNQCPEAVDPSTPLAEQAKVAAIGLRGSGIGVVSPFLETGDYTRLSEASVTLDLPPALLRVLRVPRATLSLQGSNLALWTSFSHDPESGDGSGIPQDRSWTLRLDLGF